jgi:hypothetical protein
MALVDNAWYVNFGDGSSTGYYAITVWSPGLGTPAAGTLIRQATTPTVGNERVFACIVSGAVGGSEPTWVVTRGGKTTDGSATWQECTGLSGLNGDTTNTPRWSINQTWTLGQHIYDPGTASIQICTVAGAGLTSGSPSFSATAGTTASDASATWTSLGLASNFSIWKAPQARLGNAFASTWGQAGNSFFISTIHAETQASAMTLTSPGTYAAPACCYCVAQSPGSVPPGSGDITTGTSITTTGNNALFLAGTAIYANGITFNAGSGVSWSAFNFSAGWQKLENCAIAKLGTSSEASSITTTYNTYAELVNTTMQFGTVNDGLNFGAANFIWRNTPSAIQGATLPTNLIQGMGLGLALIDGVDLSALGSGKTLVGNNASLNGCIVFKDCLLGSGVTTCIAQTYPGINIDFITSDSAATNYRQERHNYSGVSTQSTTVYRSGGASDGTTPISVSIVTTANSKWILPFQSFPIAGWNTLTGATRTVTMYGIVNGAAVPNNDQCWLECEYFGSASSPMASFANDTKANNLASGSPLSADSASNWGSGLTARQNSHAYTPGTSVISVPDNPNRAFFCISGSGNSAASEPAGYASCVDGGSVTDGGYTFRAGCRFSMVVTLTARMVGYIYGTVKAAQSSTTFYVDPVLNFS